jgi:elongation of very long chain fatty acids protein 4
MLIDILRHAYASNFKLFGNGVDSSTTGPAYGLARALWIFYVSKVAEFFDTFLMAAKRNFHQITFLHVYHHASIFMIWWVIVYFAPGGEAYFSAALNSFIHVLMYGYYLWSTFSSSKKATAAVDGKKPRVNPCQPAYWRPYITRMQLTQFCCMLFQATYDLLIPNPYPRFAIWILFIYMFTMLGLFGNFYVQAYIKSGKDREKAKKNE